MTEEFEARMKRLRAEIQGRRDIQMDVVITILNYWRGGNSSGKLRLDPFYLLSRWLGPERCASIVGKLDGRMEEHRVYSLANNYVDYVINRVCVMINHLCNCGDQELELAGRYAREQAFRAMGMEWAC